MINSGDYISQKLYTKGPSGAEYQIHRTFVVIAEYPKFYLCQAYNKTYKECFLKFDLKRSRLLRHIPKEQGEFDEKDKISTSDSITALFSDFDSPK